MRVKRIALSCALSVGVLNPGAAQETQPLSAIDWLSDVTTAPLPAPAAPILNEEAVSRGVVSETIQVLPLDAPNPDAVGLIPSAATNLPAALWGPSTGDEIEALLDRIDTITLLPTTRELLFTLLLAELDAPADSDRRGSFLLARTKTLTRLGAVEQAYALLERAEIRSPDEFALWFDLSIYVGRENQACSQLTENRSLTRDMATRIFCFARSGDWSAAALSFDTAVVLGQLDAAEAGLLQRFLDVDLDDGSDRLEVPTSPSPLTFALFEAIGEPLPTITLPLAFAHTDLRSSSGWKAQLEAAERLAAAGTLPPNQLLGLYTERRPAASGGVWDRVAALQAFDAALAAGDSDQVNAALPNAWEAMQDVGLEASFAALYATRMRVLSLDPEAKELGFRLGLMTPEYADTAAAYDPMAPESKFLAALTTGDLSEAPKAANPLAAAIAEAFLEGAPPLRYTQDLEQRAIGAALLRAVQNLGDGRLGEVRKVTEALALFRALGLETLARRIALELVLLDAPL